MIHISPTYRTGDLEIFHQKILEDLKNERGIATPNILLLCKSSLGFSWSLTSSQKNYDSADSA